LVLTAIVIGFAMTAFVLILSLRAHTELGSDHVDGVEKPKAQSKAQSHNNKGRKATSKHPSKGAAR
ncbi:MAG: hypothetical protein GX908_09740, partial [Gammaproteobacteria bacterium]|nr:hypothetical protein [Gammaproteobacteria bacterium]